MGTTITASLPMSLAGSPNSMSIVNSSTSLLTANASFTGQFENVLQYQEISCFCTSDVGGTLYLDFSLDGINTLVSFPFVSTGSTFFRAPSSQAYSRVRYTNGATNQTQFSLTTIYRPIAGGVAQLPFSTPIVDVTLANSAKAVLFGKNTNGVYTPVGTDVNDGGLNVHATNVAVPIGSQANAWNNVAVISGTTSAVIDCQYVSTVSIFGTVSANLNPLRIQVSQDNVNFYTLTTISLATGNWGTTIQLGARYVRLQAGQSATITATVAGK